MSPKLLAEFKRLYRDEFGEEISDDGALEKATALVGLFRAIYRPIPRDMEMVYKKLKGCYKDDASSPP